MRPIVVAIVVAAIPACSKSDAELEKYVASGVWQCNPRTQLPKEKLDTGVFKTPERIVLQLEPGGDYTQVRLVPESPHAQFLEYRGRWWVASGELVLQGAETWGAVRRERGWEIDTVRRGQDRRGKILESTDGKLKVEGDDEQAIGAGCTFTRDGTFPDRPAVAPLQ